MKTIETIATISPGGEVQLASTANIPVGRYRVVLVIDELPIPLEQDGNRDQDSFLAASFDLIGSIDGLPSDLSVNKIYLEGFGEK